MSPSAMWLIHQRKHPYCLGSWDNLFMPVIICKRNYIPKGEWIKTAEILSYGVNSLTIKLNNLQGNLGETLYLDNVKQMTDVYNNLNGEIVPVYKIPSELSHIIGGDWINSVKNVTIEKHTIYTQLLNRTGEWIHSEISFNPKDKVNITNQNGTFVVL